MKFMMDYLGGANYGQMILRRHPASMGVGVILNTNNPQWPKTNFWPIAERLAERGKLPFFRPHAIWEDSHIYNPEKHNKIILTEFERIADLKGKFPQVDCYFSPMCERDNNHQQFNRLIERLLEDADKLGISIVNSVTKASYWPSGAVINELHGSKMKPNWGRCAYSTDGKQAWDQNVVKLRETPPRAVMEYFAFWVSLLNGKCNDKQPHEPGADTTRRNLREAWPYPEVFPALSMLVETPEGVRLGKEHIWKTHADQHGPVRKPREGKPVFITPADGASCIVRTVVGNKLVATMPRDGNYTDGRPKYRCNEFGFQLANKARKLSGSPMVRLMINRKEIGVVHPAFRAGVWRDA